jgi:hypothetical protein
MSPVGALAWLLAAALPAAPLAVPLAAPLAVAPAAGAAIPAFSRAYATSCVTCHVTPGKLNGQGEAFRLNGYRFPDDEDRLQGEEPVALGAEPWKDLWPGAIWPGQIPGALPLSLHVANDLHLDGGAVGGMVTSWLFPAVVALQAGASLGPGVAAFAEVVWRHGAGLQVGEAKVKVQDPLPWIPPRALNVWVGAQRLHLLSFTDLSLDRAARQPFHWQWLRPSDWEPEDPATGERLVSENPFRLGVARPAVELNGVAAGRIHYGFGVARSAAAPGVEGPDGTDVYVKLRQKLGGLGLDGRPPAGTEPDAWGGQLLERSLTLEQFAYTGTVTLGGGELDEHRSLGVAARAMHGRVDVGVGHVRGRNSGPRGARGPGARHASTFGRAEYLVFPWLMASLKAERTDYRAAGAADAAFTPLRRARILPAAIVLLRQNVRVIAEGELLRDQPRPADAPPARGLWLRLDVAY